MKLIHPTNNAYTISTDKSEMDINAIHEYLSNHAYWCLNIPLDTLKKAMDNSLNFGIFYHSSQVGFARVISDNATIAYLGDVYILPEHRGMGLSKWMMETIMNYPGLQGLRRWILLTRDAHELYKKFGWNEIANPGSWMEKHDPDVYKS
jgi:GNAT superfamily N-acetyltransferase